MPISKLDPRATANLTPQQLADLALEADQEARRRYRLGQFTDGRKWELESARLADLVACHA